MSYACEIEELSSRLGICSALDRLGDSSERETVDRHRVLLVLLMLPDRHALFHAFADCLKLLFKLGVLHFEFFVCFGQNNLEVLNAFVASCELAFGNRNVLLEQRVLLDESLLHEPKLFEVTGKHFHLALLRSAVGVLDRILVLLLHLVQRNLELDHLINKTSVTTPDRMSKDGTFSQRFCKSRIRLFFIVSKSWSCADIERLTRSRSLAPSAKL